MIAKKETGAGSMDRYGFLYKKEYHTIKAARTDKVPGCFYYEWVADQNAIYIPDGRIHYVWRQEHLEEYRYEVQAVLWKRNNERLLGIGIDPVYMCDRGLQEIEDFFYCMEKLDSFEERRTYYERNGMKVLYPKKVHPLVEQVIVQIQKTAGKESVEQMACGIQYTPRQIEHVFRQQFGYGPKRYGQLLRLQEAVTAMRENETVTLAQISYDSGYADPSHMLREFKRFIGMTPKTFRETYI